ncbi:type II toxin-antitoxin system RelE/ParE family toxin [Jeotgalibacillus malaysiensis]|uniref:type II toxin-antitoxin system RelE/ParE family toxin n=1 Tax=Jeotgalibacillus malaysiensis TaxID=1508404 RepID=UPI00384B68C5
MRNIRISPIAKNDLLEIEYYITSEFDHPEAARKILSEIVQCYETLKSHHLAGRELSSKIFIPTDYRYLICNDYLIFYKYDSQFIFIYRIIAAKRDFVRILFDQK